MRRKKNWYFAHRWLGLLVSFQLLAWSVGGFMFSILDIEDVRGEIDQRRGERSALESGAIRVSLRNAIEAFARAIDESIGVREVVLRHRGERIVYELYGDKAKPLASIDATTGDVKLRISEREAASAALADFTPDASVESVELLEGEPPLEFRSGRMPVYRVILDHPKRPHIYVCPVTGEILKRRNKLWRTFDFFWMLHIMDYGGRDNFNHLLLTTMSLLAITTSASGLILWWWRIPRSLSRPTTTKTG